MIAKEGGEEGRGSSRVSVDFSKTRRELTCSGVLPRLLASLKSFLAVTRSSGGLDMVRE